MNSLNSTMISPLFAQGEPATGEGLQYSLEPSWSFAPAVLLLCAIATLAIIVFIYLRERGGSSAIVRLVLAAIRMALIGMVALMLLGWMLHRNRTDLPDIVVLIDDSESMQFEDHYEDETLRSQLDERIKAVGFSGSNRLKLAKMLLLEKDGDLLRSLNENYNLKVFRVAGSSRAETNSERTLIDSIRLIDAKEPASHLGKCLRDVLELQRGRPTAAVVLLTDGITTEGKSIGEVADYARRKSVPLYVIGLGNDQPPRDAWVSDLLVDDVVFVSDIVNFDVQLRSTGYDGQTIMLRLRQTDQDRVVAEQPVTLGQDGEPRSARISYRPEKAGEFEFVVDFEPLEGESDEDNNRVSRSVSVRDEKIRVLLAQAYPSFEYRYLTTLLGRQLRSKKEDAGKSIELTTVLQQADEGFAEADGNVRRVFPVRRDELFEYDVIIFGDVNPASLGRLEMENIADFVKVRGGGIIFISGPRFFPLQYRDTPLAELLPVDLSTASVPNPSIAIKEQFLIQPTRLGLTSPQMQLSDKLADNVGLWHSLEGMYWLLDAPDLKPAARVLAEHPTRTGTDGRNLPIISMQYAGAGKVIFHSTDETYRWRFRRGDKYFARYWIQTIRYLSRSKLLGKSRAAELTSDLEEYRRGEPIRLRVKFFDDRLAPPQDDGVTVVVEREEGKRRHITFHRQSGNRGVFEGAISNLAEGNYRVWLATPTLEGKPPSMRLSVVAPPGERARLEMDSADLKLAAKTSMGQFYTIRNADQLVEDLPRGRQVQIASLPPISIWDNWFVVLAFGFAFVVLIVTEWLLRKFVGML